MKLKFIFFLFFFALVSSLVFVKSTKAHQGGASLEKEIGNYHIDIGFEPEKVIAGEQAIFDFSINEKEGSEKDFSSIWVRIEGENNTLLATGVTKAPLGKTTVLYVFPNAGEYKLSARFQDESDTIAEASFQLQVQKGSSSSGAVVRNYFYGAAVGIVGFFILLTARKFKSKK